MYTKGLLNAVISAFFVTGAITLVFALVNKSKAKAAKTMTDQEFVMRLPWVVVAIAVSWLVLFSGLMTVTALTLEKALECIVGFAVFGLFFALGLILLLRALLFKVVVSGEKIISHNCFRKPYEFTFADIASVVRKTKMNQFAEKMTIRTNTGKKLVVEGMVTSFDRLYRRIESEVGADRLKGFDLPAAAAPRTSPVFGDYNAPAAAPYDNGEAAAHYDPMNAYRKRNLTIKRNRSSVGCLSRLKVYVEDHETVELIINDTPCRKLGELKNGEEKTFQVPARSVKVYVIAKTWSRNFCNDFYRLPEGQDDVFLSGECVFNALSNNAFRFDNNESAEVLENRKRGAKKGAGVLAVSLIIGSVIGYTIGYYLTSGRAQSDKSFFCDEMSITLTSEFVEADDADSYGCKAAYEANNVALIVIKEPFDLAEGFGDYTEDQYVDLAIRANYLANAKRLSIDGLNGFQYKYVDAKTAEVIFYTCFVYKSDEAFWLLEFSTYEEDTERYADSIEAWAKTVKFSSGGSGKA